VLNPVASIEAPHMPSHSTTASTRRYMIGLTLMMLSIPVIALLLSAFGR
jgi:hypothetical protein